MSWNSSNRAHACLWAFEFWHSMHKDAGFDEAGEWKTDHIIGFAAGGTTDMHKLNAQTHADQLDGVFTGLFRASYETNSDRDAAIEAMMVILDDNSKTVSDLADPVNEHYRFMGEV